MSHLLYLMCFCYVFCDTIFFLQYSMIFFPFWCEQFLTKVKWIHLWHLAEWMKSSFPDMTERCPTSHHEELWRENSSGDEECLQLSWSCYEGSVIHNLKKFHRSSDYYKAVNGLQKRGIKPVHFHLCKLPVNILKTNEIGLLPIDSSFTASLLTLRALCSTRNENTIGLVHGL